MSSSDQKSLKDPKAINSTVGLTVDGLHAVIRREISEDPPRRSISDNDKVPIIRKGLKEKIICHEIPPESVVNLSEQAKIFGVSRTPVKEALIFLEAGGWVLRHGSHFQATPLSLSRIREITEMRYILEPQTYIRAMKRITAPELETLLGIRDEMLITAQNPDADRALSLDIRFHRTLFRAARNPLMTEQLDRLLFHYLRFWLSTQRDIDMDYYFRESLAIIEAVQDKDEDRIALASARHIDLSLEAELNNLMPGMQ